MPLPLLQADHLTKTFQSGASSLTILDEVTFAVEAGESLALVGESGAGKSTLLYLLGGLDEPTSGQVLFESRPLSGRSEEELAFYRNRQIGFVWQSYHLLPEFTALENAAMPLLIAGESADAAYPKARLWLERVGLAERAEHRAGELSGGEQQRVTIAPRLDAISENPVGRRADGQSRCRHGCLDHRSVAFRCPRLGGLVLSWRPTIESLRRVVIVF